MAKKSIKPVLRTQSGEVINVKNPKVENINLFDIAEGLTKICRFSGQLPSKTFYSVAAHSLAVSDWIERNGGTPLEALTGLLHDASEAYLADLPSPVKRLCKDYQKIENKFQKVISKKFNIPYPYPEIVHRADKAVLQPEQLAQKSSSYYSCESGKKPKKIYLTPPYWRRHNLVLAFLARYDSLKFAKR